MNTDPVCGMKVDEHNSQYQAQYDGKKYNFCSEQCKTKFEQQPESTRSRRRNNPAGRKREGPC